MVSLGQRMVAMSGDVTGAYGNGDSYGIRLNNAGCVIDPPPRMMSRSVLLRGRSIGAGDSFGFDWMGDMARRRRPHAYQTISGAIDSLAARSACAADCSRRSAFWISRPMVSVMGR